ncbi:MAG: hypothetical protein M1838_002525 [Thelocarpon superellum]|nr:MAG: hypothetical protein M1838_002525 [Thelocarpon superellum]
MAEASHQVTRVVSVVAATLIALACGTNLFQYRTRLIHVRQYVYSAWAPQFAKRLNLSWTESNLIGNAANFGMYASGIPIGIWVDARGPRIPVMIGAFALGIGYYPIHKAYENGPGSANLFLLCFYSLLTGVGSCAAFSASLKTSALNWPHHRGSATAFPLAAFGLSAFFFAEVGAVAFPEDTSEFLFLLAIGTFAMVFVSFFFLRVVHDPPSYASLAPQRRTRSNSSRLRSTKPVNGRRLTLRSSPERSRTSIDSTRQHRHAADLGAKDSSVFLDLHEPSDHEGDETSSLVSRSSSSGPGDVYVKSSITDKRLRHVDVRGFQLIRVLEFWQLFSNLALLSGIGLMTINNIGNDAQALWSHYDDSVTQDFIQKRQLMHVSILSLASFAGRLLSGVGSDFIVKVLGKSRQWCAVVASLLFTTAQICAIRIENPHHLWAVSGLTGLGYGVLSRKHSASMGYRKTPIISGNIFNLLYGRIYDHHSTLLPSGGHTCPDGLACYRTAYCVTLAAALLGIVISLWSIHTEHSRTGRGLRLERDGPMGEDIDDEDDGVV